jgi:exopolysaccharide production protein ExoQ
MPPQIALVLFLGLIGWLWFRDIKRRPSVSGGSWVVVLWIVVSASRPVSEWFQSGRAATVDAYLEGSPADRAAFLVLIALGIILLVQRRVAYAKLIQSNRWLFIFYAYCLASVLWSDYPFVAFKRLFKDFGNVVMVMVLLTERDPIDAVMGVFLRVSYVLVPLSVVFVRFYPELGRAYTGYSMNDLMYVGVTTHKNTLGAILVVAVVFVVTDLLTRWESRAKNGYAEMVDGAIVLLMTVWLLRIADCATAVFCSVIGVGVLVMTRSPKVTRRLRFAEVYAIGGGILWFVLDSVLHVTEMVVLSLGRDMTLTTRTGAWEILLNADVSPLFGAGFKSFWAGERMTRMWNAIGAHIVQAHNGYIEVYLECGAVGLALLFIMLLAGFRKIKVPFVQGDPYARLRLTLWLLMLFYNFSEASFTQIGIFWCVTLLVIAEGATPLLVAAGAAAAGVAARQPAPFTHKWVLHPSIGARQLALNRVSRNSQ